MNRKKTVRIPASARPDPGGAADGAAVTPEVAQIEADASTFTGNPLGSGLAIGQKASSVAQIAANL